MKPGMLIVVSGPAGVGKGTIVRALSEKWEDVELSVSATTRSPRAGEIEGEHYHFCDQESFNRMVQDGELLEWVEYCGNFYGTPAARVLKQINAGKVVLLEIEVEGAMAIRGKFPDSVLVFVLPPSLEILKRRITGRGTETAEVISKRLKRAEEEFAFLPEYDYFVVNDLVDCSIAELRGIMEAERLRVKRNSDLAERYLR